MRERTITGDFTIRCIRTRLSSYREDESREVDLPFKIILKEGGFRAFYLIGGPTGHESMDFDKLPELIEKYNGWIACAGTIDRWDRLWVYPEGLSRVWEQYKEIID